jgi:hypothetical protein
MTPRRVWDRLYGDFLMPSRLDAYRGLLEGALAAGYTILPIDRFWDLLGSSGLEPGGRYLVLRHDIDTGPATAAAMWRIERSLGIVGSWYFRLSTLDLGLMAAIAADGAEVSYHYEELATVAKAHRARTHAAGLALVAEAQARFRKNLGRLRARTGLPFRTVASHGDFVNRHLDVMNWAILVDPAFRAEVGIELETYDDACMRHVTSRHADTTYPDFWTGEPPEPAIARGEPVVYLLVHPGAWQVERRASLRGNLERIREGLSYAAALPGVRLPRLRSGTRRRPGSGASGGSDGETRASSGGAS